MLKSKWKSGETPVSLTSQTESTSPELVRVGQVRTFGIGKIDPVEKSIELVLEAVTRDRAQCKSSLEGFSDGCGWRGASVR